MERADERHRGGSFRYGTIPVLLPSVAGTHVEGVMILHFTARRTFQFAVEGGFVRRTKLESDAASPWAVGASRAQPPSPADSDDGKERFSGDRSARRFLSSGAGKKKSAPPNEPTARIVPSDESPNRDYSSNVPFTMISPSRII